MVTKKIKRTKVRFSDKYGNTPYHIASMYFETANVKIFLEHGADINKQGNKGKTSINKLYIFFTYFS